MNQNEMDSHGTTRITPRAFWTIALSLMLLTGLLVGTASAGAPGKRAAMRQVPPGHQPKDRATSMHLPDRVIVKLASPDAGESDGAVTMEADRLSTVVQRYNAVSVRQMFPSSTRLAKPAPAAGTPDISRMYVVTYSAPIDPFSVAAEISAEPGVEYAEPWFIYALSGEPAGSPPYIPNDTDYTMQWYLTRVRADSAWGITQGDTGIVIGFVDTGVQPNHPDISANLYRNPGENGPDGLGGDKSTNGLDDDSNGKVDDFGGWDFGGPLYQAPSEDNAPYPTAGNNGHGTATAGIGAAATDNVTGVAGMGFRTKILPVKATADNDMRGLGGTPFIIAGYEGIVYAAEAGAHVISLSWGGPGYSQAEQDVVSYAAGQGAVVVAAAGNTGTASELQYPASYDNVVSVAATRATADFKAGYSSYNERVDVSAPGGDGTGVTTAIWTTSYTSTYGLWTGTSMSTPLVAGIAGLVRAMQPSYTVQQVAEQIRVTCDDIYGANSSYRYRLGKGRVNAYRALTETWPSVRMTSMTASDSAGGNDNSAFEANEDITITMSFMNYLAATTGGLTVNLFSTDAFVTVVDGSYSPGSLGTGGAASNASAPFKVHVNPGIPALRNVTFTLEFTDGTYFDRQQFTILFNPTFATHSVNNVSMTVTNNGRIGFQNFPDNTQGVGFVFGNGNQLFEGGLLIGTSATKLVNVVRNATGTQDAHFTSSQIYAISRPGPLADEQGSTRFTDAAAPAGPRIGLEVSMFSYAWSSPPDDDYVILQYDIKNTTVSTISNLYAGLFFDWDMLDPGGDPLSFEHNFTGFDASRGLAYSWYDTSVATVHAGVAALEGAAGYRGLLNALGLDLSPTGKWNWLSGGVVPMTMEGDIHHAISSGPYTIPAGGAQKVAFAIIGGENLADIQANADAAQTKWNAIKTLVGTGPERDPLPSAFELKQNYPNPFNPSTTIGFSLPERGRARLTIRTILGEEVAVLHDGELPPGSHELVWDGTTQAGLPVSSGVYYYSVEYESGGTFRVETRKTLLVR